MTNDPPPPRISTSWPEGIAVVLSIVALLVSGYSLIVSQRLHQDERATELVHQMYADYLDLVSPELWEVGHLQEVPANYEASRDFLRAHATALPPEEQRRVYALERTMATRVLTVFELHLRQWERALAIEDEDREDQLRLELDFWAEFALRNPRLLWFWDEGGLVETMDDPTVEFYDARVLNDPDHPLVQEPDPEGILPGFAWGG